MTYRFVMAALALLSSGLAVSADRLILLDSTRLDHAVAARGAGLDGRIVRPRAVARACIQDGVFGAAAYSPQTGRCRAATVVPGLGDLIDALALTDGTSVKGLINAGGLVMTVPSRRSACVPGQCDRTVFQGIGYPIGLVGRPQPDPLPVPTISELSVQPDALIAGQTATLSWSADSVSNCDLTASNSGATLSVRALDQRPVSPQVDTVWTLTCAGPGGVAIEQTVATVAAPPGSPTIRWFAALPDDVPVGTETRLTWDSRHAAGCVIDSGNSTVTVPVRGTRRLTVTENSRFVLTCQNPSGSTVASVDVLSTLAEEAATIEAFEAGRSDIKRGDSVMIRWQAAAATRCRLRDDRQATVWNLANAGRFKVVPETTTTYALECRNAHGVDHADLIVSVVDSDAPLGITSFELTAWEGASGSAADRSALRLTRPGLIRASWTTSSARACRLGDHQGHVVDVPVNGSRLLRADSTMAFQIYCIGRGAEAQSWRQVQVVRDLIHLDDFQG